MKVELEGVPETLLWTLYHRSIEARRPDAILEDPRAVREVRRFLGVHPDGTVVALGEGLETQFWRVDNGRVRWVAVDVSRGLLITAQGLLMYLELEDVERLLKTLARRFPGAARSCVALFR